MSRCFVIRNHQDLYLDKHKEWVDGRDNQSLFRCTHKDEAINMLFEISSKDIDLRAEYIDCELNDKKHPLVEVLTILEIETESDQDLDTNSQQQSTEAIAEAVE